MTQAVTKKRAPARKKQLAKAKPTPIVQAPQSQEEQIVGALMKSIESGALQPEQLDMVLSAQERILDRQAKQEFATAMAECQAEIPNVLKNKFNQQTNSKFEDLESLNSIIKPVYTKWGFAVSFNTGKADNPDWLRILADVSHRAGWVKEYFIDLPYDAAGIAGKVNKTMVHATASTRTYGRRYLLKEIFNLTTSEDADDDGNISDFGLVISADQEIELDDLINDSGADRQKFLDYMRLSTLGEMPASDYPKAKRALEAKKKS